MGPLPNRTLPPRSTELTKSNTGVCAGFCAFVDLATKKLTPDKYNSPSGPTLIVPQCRFVGMVIGHGTVCPPLVDRVKSPLPQQPYARFQVK